VVRGNLDLDLVSLTLMEAMMIEMDDPRRGIIYDLCSVYRYDQRAVPANRPGMGSTRSPATSMTWHRCPMRGGTSRLS
jgi:hypothetical protein